MEEEMKKAQAEQMPELGMGMGGMGAPGGLGGGLPPPPPGEPSPLDLGGAPPELGGDLGGAPPPPPGGGAPPPLPEGYDRSLESELERLLQEEQIREDKQAVQFAQRYLDSQVEMNNGFDYILNHNELDGLTSGVGKSEEILVESVLSSEEIQESRKITRALLLESGEETYPDEHEITVEDLPSRMVVLG
jgi:hypothetical protein